MAVGNDCSTTNLDSCNADPAIWTSIDGRTWDRMPHDPVVFPGCSDQGGHEVNEYLEASLNGCEGGHYRPTLQRISVTDHGVMAVGTDPTWTMAWFSSDGLIWSRIDHSAAPSYPMVDGQGWWIYTEDPGAWTSIGMLQPGLRCMDRYEGDEVYTDCLGFIWSSSNGEIWTGEAWSDDVLTEWWPTVSVAVDGGAVVLGNRSPTCTLCPFEFELEPTSVVALHTSDGVEWTQATIPSPEIGRVWSGSVITTPIGLVALAEQQDFDPRLAMMWHSDDGLTWEAIPEMQGRPEDLSVIRPVWDGDELLLFGTATQNGQRVHVLGRWAMP